MTDKDTSASNVFPSCTGVVILLDALGVSQFTLQGCADFLAKRQHIIGIVPKMVHSHWWYVADGDDGTKQVRKKLDQIEFKAFTFGDSILLFSVGLTVDVALLQMLSKIVCDMVVQGLAQGVLLRGAVSIGDIVFDDQNTAIGPAIAEAAAWYEELQMVGALYTPSIANAIENIFSQPEQWHNRDSWLDQFLIKTMVDLKNHGSKELWLARWPSVLERAIIQKGPSCPYADGKSCLIQAFTDNHTELKDPTKSANTHRFFEETMCRKC